jgi:hypothetical protein
LRKAPVVQNLVLQLAGEGDPTDDPTAPWPDDRSRVRIGRLEIIRPTTVEEIGDPVMLHDPTRLNDGIEASDDPVLAVRRRVYARLEGTSGSIGTSRFAICNIEQLKKWEQRLSVSKDDWINTVNSRYY